MNKDYESITSLGYDIDIAYGRKQNKHTLPNEERS